MEPWFDELTAGRFGGIIGGCFGILGGFIGSITGWCVCRGWKKMIYGAYGFMTVISAASLAIGIVALLAEQPFHVWYGFVLGGGLGVLLFAVLGFFILRMVFTQKELQQIQAKDI
jgi:uncharacterized membrane protein YfcA